MIKLNAVLPAAEVIDNFMQQLHASCIILVHAVRFNHISETTKGPKFQQQNKYWSMHAQSKD